MQSTAYRAATDEPVVQLLVSDDAPQLSGICAEQALCWVHDGRHYKKLRPRVALREFLQDSGRSTVSCEPTRRRRP